MKVHNIFLIGPMGAGKSTIGRTLAKALNFEFYDSDEEIESRTGADIAWIFDLEGEEGFRKREQQVLDDLTQMSRVVLATGGGVVNLSENRNALAARGTVIYLQTSLAQQLARTQHDTRRPLLQTEDVETRLANLIKEREPLYKEIADLEIDTDNLSVKAVANKIMAILESDELG
jgi:shikimate kinase